MPSFDEVELPTNISKGAQGGPGFSTVVIVTSSGAEQRVAEWSRSRGKWTVGHNLRSYPELDALVAFFVARAGRFKGFRFKDWLDFSSKVGGVETKHDTALLTSTTFQILKAYSSGGVSYTRKVAKPIGNSLTNTVATQADSTVKVYNASGTEITSGWTVNLTTGIVTFGSAPGYLPKATFEYHVPVRFDSDQMEVDLAEATYGNWPGIELVELRV